MTGAVGPWLIPFSVGAVAWICVCRRPVGWVEAKPKPNHCFGAMMMGFAGAQPILRRAVQLAQRLPDRADQGWHRIGLGEPAQRSCRLGALARLGMMVRGGKKATDAMG